MKYLVLPGVGHAPGWKTISSRAISPMKSAPRTPSNITYNKTITSIQHVVCQAS